MPSPDDRRRCLRFHGPSKGSGRSEVVAGRKSIVFTSSSNPEDLAKQARQKKKEAESKNLAKTGSSPAPNDSQTKAAEAESTKATSTSSPTRFTATTRMATWMN